MPAKKDTAFKKDSEEARRLLNMFLNGDITWDTPPREVLNEFPTLAHFTPASYRNGFHRVKGLAQNIALCRGSSGENSLKRGKFG
jgi:hypothetical protein